MKAHSTKLCKGYLSVKKSIDNRVAPVDRFVLHTKCVFVCLFVCFLCFRAFAIVVVTFRFDFEYDFEISSLFITQL